MEGRNRKNLEGASVTKTETGAMHLGCLARLIGTRLAAQMCNAQCATCILRSVSSASANMQFAAWRPQTWPPGARVPRDRMTYLRADFIYSETELALAPTTGSRTQSKVSL